MVVKYKEDGSARDKELAKFAPDSNNDVAVRIKTVDTIPAMRS